MYTHTWLDYPSRVSKDLYEYINNRLVTTVYNANKLDRAKMEAVSALKKT